jgi:predicted Zn-dependent protease
MAVKTTPGYDEAYFALSNTYRRLNRTADADRLLAIYSKRSDIRRRIEGHRMVLATQPNDLSLYVKIADLQMQNNDQAAAVATLQNALQVDPKAPQIQRMLAQIKGQPNNMGRSGP